MRTGLISEPSRTSVSKLVDGLAAEALHASLSNLRKDRDAAYAERRTGSRIEVAPAYRPRPSTMFGRWPQRRLAPALNRPAAVKCIGSATCALQVLGQDRRPGRPGLERLLRYCARPAFTLERLEPLGDNRRVYRFDWRTQCPLRLWS